MSFRKRNVVLGSPNPRTTTSTAPGSSPTTPQRQEKIPSPGTRPSPLDGRPTTSTGTSSLDQLLAGHSGLPLGTSLLIEEAGTTDFGGTVLRYYAAEGLVQGHQVHLLGYGDSWRRDLPGLDLSGGSKSKAKAKESASDEKMKIAWRYETLGNTAGRAPSSQGLTPNSPSSQGGSTFCHSFDLTKRLENSSIQGALHTTPIGDALAKPLQTPFKRFLDNVLIRIKTSPPSTIHRIVVPTLLSPTIYPSSACRPQEVLQFLHSLRGLLRQFPGQITAMLTLPVSLYPRSTGLTRWAELLADGVLELIPLQHQSQMSREPGKEEKSQGMMRAHSLPVFHEKGGALEGSWSREDLSFKLSASSGMVITPFALPPVGEEEEAKASKPSENKKESLEF